MAELLSNLESNDPKLVEESKQKFHEQFNTIKDPWLVNGLYDTYLSSNSTRLMEVLVNVKEPHYTYLFDKISESIRSSKDNMKIQGLTLLGHIVRSQPAWMYKITSHSLMKDLLQLLKTETDILTLLSALMALIVLLPLIPSLMASYLQDVFDIFRRLAGWNCHETDEMHEEQTAHMQVALYALFLRLYGMYPCNFLAYLRDQFRKKDLYPIFLHTIKPMLDTVKMNPHLVTTSIANETSTERWKKIGAHDIIVECERFSLDLPDRCSHEQCFISTCRPKSTTSILNSENSTQLYSLKTFTSNVVINDGDFFSPSMILHPATPPVNEKSLPTPIPFTQLPSNVQTTLISSVTQISQESSSPPEAAIEATPETTPVRDNRMNVRLPPANSTIARAHTFVVGTKPLGSGHNTPINSQPSSPMRKEVSPFNFQDIPRHTSTLVKRSDPANRLQKLIQDRSQMGDANTRSPFMMVPTSPSKSLTSEKVVSGSPMQRLDSPLSQEDEEVSQIVRQGETIHYQELRQCDSVLHEVEGFRGNEDDGDNCEQEHGSPCTEGGLHMPNSKSINDLTNRIRRLRYHSQCADDGEKYERSTGSSPGNAISYPNNISVRRAYSCPEMKKSPIISGKDNINEKTLLETDEDGGGDTQDGKPITNGIDPASDGSRKKREKAKVCLRTTETQTENLIPMPYDHLFLSIFPSLESNESATLIKKQEKSQCANIYDISDKYLDLTMHTSERELVIHLKKQIELLRLQLQFEKHRREMHAMKNRRLFADARNTRALEEHKDALMDTVRMIQSDFDNLKKKLEVLNKEKEGKEKEASENAKFRDQQYKILESECRKLKADNEHYRKELENLQSQTRKLYAQWQDSESNLLNAIAEVKIAKEQADAGERGRMELEHVNKELLLLGELQLKYQERLNDLALTKRGDIEQKRLFDVHKHDMQVLTQQLETKKKNLEACGTRIAELESIIQKHDDSCAVLKRQLNDIKEEYHEKLKAVESKYQTQLAVNRCLEEKVVDLWQRIEILNKKVISPDISSCHEVNATLTDRTGTAQGLSSQSSPLSASLASSEGSMASTISEVKNLQKIVDQKDDNE